jgi:CheY-like chemotaxis protein
MTKTILLVDAGADPLADVAERLRGLGYRTVRAKSMDEAQAALVDPRFQVGVALVPPDLPALDLERALRAFRTAHPDGALPLVAAGRRPDAEHRARMRRAGAEWGLWRPVDDHTLRFQVNRALAGGGPVVSERRAPRVPVHWPVKLAIGSREKEARLYTLSACGAFLATPRPSLPQTLLHLSLPLPESDLRLAARVVMTNVPGNLTKSSLPVGMAVRFTGHTPEIERQIRAYTDTRDEALRI